MGRGLEGTGVCIEKTCDRRRLLDSREGLMVFYAHDTHFVVGIFDIRSIARAE